MEWYFKVLKQYADFNGRARRKEYWMFTIINGIISFIISVIDHLPGLGFLHLLYNLAVIIPSLAVSVRRLHDVGKSGWFILLGFLSALLSIALIVPLVANEIQNLEEYIGETKWLGFVVIVSIIGWVWLFILHCKDSEEGTNQYGPNPKNPEDELQELGRA